MEIHELANIIPLMSAEEYQSLKADIQENGLLSRVTLYKSKILDGRNRYKVCQELNIEPQFEEYKGDNPLSFVISENVKRRHLNSSQLACVAIDLLPFTKEEAKKRMEGGRNQYSSPRQKIAYPTENQGKATEKAAEFVGSNKEYVRQAENLKKENPEAFEEVKQGKKTISEIQTEQKRKKAKQKIEILKSKGVILPKGKYACLVVDPPWPMKKIERDVSPNQVEFDYPTMDEEELKEFGKITNQLADENCHLYLWTTHKFLPMAFRLVENWGFKYQCLMTWIKNVGFTPFSWMYSTEHALFCTKGNLPLLKMGERLDFNARVREHSRKPDIFYEKVKLVSPEPRIDIFSREKREGFDQYGNELERFKSE